MLYAKTYDNNGTPALMVVYQPKDGFTAFDVPSADHLAIENGAIVIIEPVPVVPVLSKQQRLDSIIVTTQSGKPFDGNQTARVNMTAAISLAGFANQTSTSWKLANNMVETVTLIELKEALHLAMLEVAEIVGVA